jgi:hypothetical protein
MCVVESVDQVQIARSAARCANRDFARNRSIASGGECSRLLVADVRPADGPVAVERIGEAVERITRYAVHTPHASSLERLNDQV